MDGILTIQNEISECKYFDLYKKALINHQSFRLCNEKNSDQVVQNIVQKLSKPHLQEEGLILLHCLLNQCSIDIIEQKGYTWMTTCLKICSQSKSHSLVSLSYQVLGVLLEKSCNIPELGKSFSGNYIEKICETFRLSEQNTFLPALRCLSICLKTYPGSCSGSSRNLIEKFLTKFIDTSDINLVKLSGKCFHLLQQVKGGGASGNSQKISWKTYQSRLIGSLHNILDLLFLNCTEYYNFVKEEECLTLYPLTLSNEPVLRTGQLSTRFKNLTNFLIITIRDPFPVAKALQPKKILNLITRGLSVTCDTLQHNLILDNITVGAVLPELHVELYKLLETLISTLKNHLNIFHEQILGLFDDSLRWTCSGKSEGFKKPYNELRIQIYNTFAIWCQTMKFASCGELIFDHIFRHIDNDITPFRNEIVLQVSNDNRRHMSKKIRKQLQKVQNESSHLGQIHIKGSKNAKMICNDADNKNVCAAALKFLKYIYVYTSCFMKPLVIKELHEKLIKICLTFTGIENSKVSLYSSNLCREGIYDMLSILVVSPHHLCPPPTSMIFKLLINGRTNDFSSLVRKCCSDRLNFLEKILHPQKQCLYFPPELIDIKHALRVRELSTDEYDERQLEQIKDTEFAIEQDNNQIENEYTEKIVTEKEILTENHYSEESEKNDLIEKKGFEEENQNDESICENISVNEENITNSIQNTSEKNDEKKAISCPKKRMLHNLQKSSEDEADSIQNDVLKSPKRIKIADQIVEIEENVESNIGIVEEISREKVIENESLFNEILATFTDELNEE